MNVELTPEQGRVLGALMEKENTTPDYYPLTLNGLVTACNQKSNRDPVMQLVDSQVLEALDGLRELQLAWTVEALDSRVPKYEHNVDKKLNLTLQEVAVLCVLLLRGAQTIGEIRTRSARIYPFETLDEVAITLQTLNEREDGPLTIKLPVQPGRKEARFFHLLCGDPDFDALAQTPLPATASKKSNGVEAERVDELALQVESLSEKVTRLESELSDLRHAFGRFKAEFE